jgi:hypothetical protein
MSAEIVYFDTFRKVIDQNNKFYLRFPAAEAIAVKVVNHIMSQDGGRIVTPMGNHLTPASFQLLGFSYLGSSHGFEHMWHMLESAFEPDGRLSFAFLKSFDCMLAFDTNPLYALLHESIYCQGSSDGSRWAAQRVRDEHFHDVFDAEASAASGGRVMFTGEMIFPHFFDDIAELRRVKDTADLIAQESKWSILYPSVSSLEDNSVPLVASATYYEDMFVSFGLAEDTLRRLPNVRKYVTSEYLHDGIRENGAAIFEKLHGLIDGSQLLR